MDRYLSTLLFLHPRHFLSKDLCVARTIWEGKSERTKEILPKWKCEELIVISGLNCSQIQNWVHCNTSLGLLYLGQATAKWQQSDKEDNSMQTATPFIISPIYSTLLSAHSHITIPSSAESLRQGIIKSLFRIPFDHIFLCFLKITLLHLIVNTKKELNKMMKLWSECTRTLCCPNLWINLPGPWDTGLEMIVAGGFRQAENILDGLN